MRMLVGLLAGVGFAVLVAGCNLDTASVGKIAANLGAGQTEIGSAVPTTPAGTPQPGNAGKPVSTAGTLVGHVLAIDGRPAPGVPVRAFLVANNSNGLVSNNSNGYFISALAPFNLQAACPAPSSALATCTDAQGNWTLRVAGVASADAEFNVEAVYADDIKAMRQRAVAAGPDLELQLAFTGTIRGKVKTWVVGVTDFLGVDVFVPGTGYVAKTDRDGNYEIPFVPPGVYKLAAMHPDLGRAESPGVDVRSKQTTVAGDLGLQTVAPGIAQLQPVVAAPGQSFLIKGNDFGTSQGKHPSVLINGDAAAVLSASDTEIKAVVPNGAVSGVVTVVIGGVPSNTLPFAVFKTLDIFPEYMDAEAKSKDAVAPASDKLALDRARRYVARGIDAEGKMVAEASVSWAVSAPDVAAFDSGGLLRPAKSGQFVLSAQAGLLFARNPITVDIVSPIAEILLSPAEVTLCPYNPDPSIPENERTGLPDSGIMRPVTRFLDGATASLPVIWYGLGEWLTVSADGTMKVKAGAPYTDLQLVVRSIADLEATASALVHVVRQGTLQVGIE